MIMWGNVTEVCLDSVLLDLKEKGFALSDNLFSDQILSGLVNDIQISKANFKKSGIGRDSQIQENLRGDYISWLDPNHLSISQIVLFQTLDKIKNTLNEKYFLNLKDFECHLTYYPENTSYEKHLDTFLPKTTQDAFRAIGGPALSAQSLLLGVENLRKISFVVYLNKDWSSADGGELVLYSKNDTEILKILPEFGKSIFFLSEEFPHEVLTNNKERLSLTGWMF